MTSLFPVIQRLDPRWRLPIASRKHLLVRIIWNRRWVHHGHWKLQVGGRRLLLQLIGGCRHPEWVSHRYCTVHSVGSFLLLGLHGYKAQRDFQTRQTVQRGPICSQSEQYRRLVLWTGLLVLVGHWTKTACHGANCAKEVAALVNMEPRRRVTLSFAQFYRVYPPAVELCDQNNDT